MRTLRALVPAEKAATLAEWLRVNGCTLGAMLETFAELVEQVGTDPSTWEDTNLATELWVARAQEITVERRRR
jgi:hypothetical protein